MTTEILFTCPKCDKQFLLEDLWSHNKNQERMEEYIGIKYKEQIIKEKQQAVELTRAQLIQDYQQKLNDLKGESQEKQTALQMQINTKISEIKQIKDEQQAVVDLAKAELLKVHQEQISKLGLEKVQKLNELETIINQKNAEINKIKDEQQAAVDLAKAELLRVYQEKINKRELEVTQKQNDLQTIINQKNAEINKIKDEQQTAVDLAKAQLIQDYQQKLNLLNIENQKKQTELEIQINNKLNEIRQIKEIEDKKLAVLKNELMENHNKEITKLKEFIHELEIKNAQNRVIQNKIIGENWEREVENELSKAFGSTNDIVEKINRSIDATKADYLQIIRDNQKNEVGKIVYEVKNAEWSNNWIPKLYDDAAKQGTKYGILVTNKFSEKHHIDVGFAKSDEYENIWITDPWSFVFVAQIIRKLIEVEHSFNKQKNEITNSSQEDTLKKYVKTIDALNNYMISELPSFIKNFRKQLENLEVVEGSLVKNAKKLETIQKNLRKEFDKKIIERLEKITEQKVIKNDENELNISELDLNNQTPEDDLVI